MRRLALALLITSGLWQAPAADLEDISPRARAGVVVLYEQPLKPYPLPPLVPITIGEKTFMFFLDTGTNVSAFDSSMSPILGSPKFVLALEDYGTPGSKSAGAKKSDGSPVGGRRLENQFFDLPASRLGNWPIPPGPVTVLNWEMVRNASGMPMQGLLGSNALENCTFCLDFDRGRLQILKGAVEHPAAMRQLKLVAPAPAKRMLELPPSDGKANSLRPEERRSYATHGPRVILELDGRALEFLVDTGNSSCMTLDRETFAALGSSGVIRVTPGKGGRFVTASGVVMNQTGFFEKGSLMGIDLHGMPVDEGGRNSLGMRFLVNFNTAIDFQDGNYWYERRAVPPPISPTEMTGITFLYSGGHNRVDVLNARGPAEKAGLKVSDRVIRLGPLKEAEINSETLYELCLHHAAERLEVEYARPGRSKHIVTHLRLPEKMYSFPPSAEAQ
jgi:hypothetical protein